ncbi:hypothetical protein EHQ10_16875 [Leptospira bouyouniensis]|uniref:Uncharacterized protein n=1 Tax=Leptospira bouyouniensis TaxID=2484911 RepID=A0ABY2L134_9LEPT|nr:hypothetical protein EHQ10_16875 [Leptospira bouyouniensis]
MCKSGGIRVKYFGVLIVCIILFVLPVIAVDESKEPNVQYTININGKEYDLIADVPKKINGNFQNLNLLLKAGKWKEFSYGGIYFLYFASFTWEADIQSDSDKNWVLSGNDFKIMYFVLSDAVTLEDYADSFADRMGKENTKSIDIKDQFGNEKYTGKKIFVKLAGVDLVYEIYAIPTREGSRILIFQDAPESEDKQSQEKIQMMDLFRKNFKILYQ